MAIASVNPATGEVLASFTEHTASEVAAAIERTQAAWQDYRLTTLDQRAAWMRTAADLLEADNEAIATIMTQEMGKSLKSARAEAAKCVKGMRFYADHAPAMLADEPVEATSVGAQRAFTRYAPLGIVLAVMPWNFPLWQVVRFAAPALMAGNAGLLKHASNVPQCAVYLEDLFRRAGFPDGIFTTLLIGSAQVETVLRDPRVRAATLTGSEPAGQAVAAICGDEIKKTVLELGGSDPYIVMPSADVERAAQVAVTARCQNNGQSCIAAKRFIVHTDVYDRFAEAFVAGMAALTVGDPMAEATDVGPLATERGRADVAAMVEDARAKGAEVLCGGFALDGPGWFYAPTVVGSLTPDMAMYADEVFGPVAGLYRVNSLDEAIDLGNATAFGLGSNAWTTDPAEQERFINDLDAGTVTINGMTTSYNELPFGGAKRSGYGRELSAHGIREFCSIRAVWVG